MEGVANYLFNRLVRENHTTLERSKLNYGIRIMLTNLTTIVTVYMVAILLGCLLETMITNVAFFLIRQVALGYHFKSLFQCVGYSIIGFPLVSKLITYVSISDWIVYTIFALTTFIIVMIAPIGTVKQPVYNEKHRLYLRKRIWPRLGVLLLAILLVPTVLKPFIALGLVLECAVLVVQKIIVGRC
ncbi:MAG TPA: accessory gene regulator B family protein [Candidatus Paenibacillus intestinavium]|nr:accessory gene regulator B family protein [Candidatus Paenibacillus intestinavium]